MTVSDSQTPDKPISVLFFMGVGSKKGAIPDGTYSGSVRCDCSTRANLQAVVRDGEFQFTGCPVCRRVHTCEVTNVAGKVEVGFFPPGIVIL
jgi:hypothetical protein